jgi:hypothetical protein
MLLTIFLDLFEDLYKVWRGNLSNTKYSKGCLIVLGAISLFFIVFICVPIADYQIGLIGISLKTGIPPSMPALKTYLEKEALLPGMPRDEVRAKLGSMATRVNISDLSNVNRRFDHIVFCIGYWPLNRFDILIDYDKNLKLTSVSIRDHDSP